MRVSHRLLLVLAAVVASACADQMVEVCAGLGVVGPSFPESASVRVGSSFIATAGVDYDTCLGGPSMRPAARFRWTATDRGMRAGTTVITPVYTTSGRSVPPIRVVVLP